MSQALKILVILLLLLPHAGWSAGCSLIDQLAAREAEHEKLVTGVQGGKSGMGKKLDSLLDADRREWARILDELGNGGDETKLAARLAELEKRSQKTAKALELFGPLDRELAAATKGKLAATPGAQALVNTEAKKLEALYDEWAATGKFDEYELARMRKRANALSTLNAGGKPIVYVNPGHHDPTKAGMGKRSVSAGTSSLPPNAEQLWAKAIPDPAHPEDVWWAWDGEHWHRFEGYNNQATGTQEFHWNGSDRPSDDPKLVIKPDKIPGDVKKYFGQ